jgi:hypothetical protein
LKLQAIDTKDETMKIQEQQIGFVNRWSGVRFPRPAPIKHSRNSGFQGFALSGKGGMSGAEQRFASAQKPEQLIRFCSRRCA